MSDQPVPSSPQPPEAKGSLSQAIAKIAPIARKVWVTSRPTLAQGVKATIGLLQRAEQQLETQIANDPSDVQPLNLEPLQKASTSFWAKTRPLWVKLIAGVRGKLPEDISIKLSDRALSGIVAGMALLLLSLTTHLPSGTAAPRSAPARTNTARPNIVATQPRPQRPAPVAPVAPTAAPTVAPTQPFPSALTAPALTAPGNAAAPNSTAKANAPIVPPTAGMPPTVAPIVTQPVTPTNPVQAATPNAAPIVTTPIAPAPIPNAVQASAPTTTTAVSPTIAAPKPAPVKKLTAQEKLLAKLQESLGDQANLVATVQPNKAAGRLQVRLQSDWYQLDLAQQDQLAQTLFTKAQTLKFRSLELLDSKGEVLARSPVVGNEMVVLLRQAMDAI